MRYGVVLLMIRFFAVKGLINVSKKITFHLFHSSVSVRRATVSPDIKPILHINEIDGALEAHIQPFKPFRIEFQASRLRASHTERVVKAVGTCDLVFDLTAGLGRDAIVLAAAGRRVVMIERNKILFKLLQDGIRRLHIDAPSIAHRVFLLHADSTALPYDELMQQALSHFNLTNNNTVKPMTINVYLDPMYPTPPGDRRAKSKKETQILQALTEHDYDSSTSTSTSTSSSILEKEEGLLFQAACSLATGNGRIVVKRGLKDPPLRISLIPPINENDCKKDSRYLKPRSVLEGSTQRFDLYFMDRLSLLQQQGKS